MWADTTELKSEFESIKVSVIPFPKTLNGFCSIVEQKPPVPLPSPLPPLFFFCLGGVKEIK